MGGLGKEGTPDGGASEVKRETVPRERRGGGDGDGGAGTGVGVGGRERVCARGGVSSRAKSDSTLMQKKRRWNGREAGAKRALHLPLGGRSRTWRNAFSGHSLGVCKAVSSSNGVLDACCCRKQKSRLVLAARCRVLRAVLLTRLSLPRGQVLKSAGRAVDRSLTARCRRRSLILERDLSLDLIANATPSIRSLLVVTFESHRKLCRPKTSLPLSIFG